MNESPARGPFAQAYEGFLGFDFAHEDHHVVLVDSDAQVAMRLDFPHSAAGWATLQDQLVEEVGADLSAVAVVLETSQGAAVECLLAMGVHVYPISPKAAERYRDRKAPSGVKDDDLDAWSMADGLRTDGHGWRRLRPDDPLTQELRLLCRDEVHLIEKRTALVCELKQALYEYYPAVLEAFDNWTRASTWAFVEAFPTPRDLQRKGKRRWEKFLHSHRLYRPQTYERRLEIFARATDFCGPPAVMRAKSRLAVALAKQLRVLATQLQEYRAVIEGLFDQHPDRDLFGLLPGAGDKLAPRLLSEFGDDPNRFDDAQAMQCYAGTAPVTKKSGKRGKTAPYVRMRRACNKFLRAAVHLWADCSRRKSTWAAVYYKKKRADGLSHACALRCLGQRWLKILHKIRQTRRPYDEALHTRNQVEHGSWVVRLSS